MWDGTRRVTNSQRQGCHLSTQPTCATQPWTHVYSQAWDHLGWALPSAFNAWYQTPAKLHYAKEDMDKELGSGKVLIEGPCVWWAQVQFLVSWNVPLNFYVKKWNQLSIGSCEVSAPHKFWMAVTWEDMTAAFFLTANKIGRGPEKFSIRKNSMINRPKAKQNHNSKKVRFTQF